jgi:hypothetical protein
METEDLVVWWRALRKDVAKANDKLLAIRAWWEEQKRILEEE